MVVVRAVVVKTAIITRGWVVARTKSLLTRFYLDITYKTAFLCQHTGNAVTLQWRLG